MNTARDLIAFKGGEVWSVCPDDTVYDALTLMADKDIGAVLVMDGERLVGILSERDYARKVILRGKSSKTTPVNEIMSTHFVIIGPEETCQSCMEIMSNYHIRHLPVIEDNYVIGVISASDVMREIIFLQGQTIRFWEDLELDR
ncbi:MAG TPA: CBS domain-containing protein [Levilinea sp.]|nr:CBS domain-containing protein [Levilinea sp.]